MSKVFTTSATGIAFLTAAITGISFVTGIYQVVSDQVELTASRITLNEDNQLASAEKDNLLLAMIVGKVANATSEEKAVKHHQAAQMLITNYNLTTNRHNSSSIHFTHAD